MTAMKITTHPSGIEEEDLTPNITNLVAQWYFPDFATEVRSIAGRMFQTVSKPA